MGDKPVAVRKQFGGHWYRIGALPVNEAMHISRTLIGLPTSGVVIKSKGKTTFSMAEIARTLSSMPRDDAEELMYGLLQTTQRETGAGAQPITTGPGVYTLADLKLIDLYRLAYESYLFNLHDFVVELLEMFETTAAATTNGMGSEGLTSNP